MTDLTRRGFLVAVAAAGALSLSGCFPRVSEQALIMASGEQGGSYYQFGGLLATALRRTSDIRLEPLITQGSVENIGLLAGGEVQLALALADSAESASVDGGLVAIGRVYQNYLQCIVRADSDIRSLSGLSGRSVSLGAPGSGAVVTTRRVLEAAGMGEGPAAPIPTELPLGEALDALGAGAIDAAFWSGGIPTPLIAGFAARVPLTLLDTAFVLPALREQYAAYTAATIPAGVYGMPRAVNTVGISNILLARPDLDDAIVASLVDTLIDEAPALAPANALSIQYLTPGSLIDTSSIPLHPAAVRRYRERYG